MSAQVVFAGPTVDAASGTAPVIVELDDRRVEALPGAAVTVRLASSTARGPARLVVPGGALRSGAAGERSVLVVEGGVARARKITSASRRDGAWEVQGELGEDDLVIVDGAAAGEGEAVRPLAGAP